MLEKFKGIRSNVTDKASEAVEGIAASLKGGVDSLAQTANTVGDTLNEKAVRASTAKMCTILEIAMDEIRSRPLSAQPVALTATVNFGLASLEMQVQLQPPDAPAGTDESVPAQALVKPD